jgi:hypothetical protein
MPDRGSGQGIPETLQDFPSPVTSREPFINRQGLPRRLKFGEVSEK